MPDKRIPKDANNETIQTANSFITQDGADTPITSPKTVSTSVVTLAVPRNAAELVIAYTDNSLQVSDVVAMATYTLLPATTTGFVYPCAGMSSIYIKRGSGTDCSVSFFFKLL